MKKDPRFSTFNDKNEVVKARLEFIIKLLTLREEFKGKHLIISDDNGWTHPYQHFEGLIYYLALTCFDILGSKDDYVNFQSWLTSHKFEEERNLIFKNIIDKELNAKIISEVYEKYNLTYGVTKSFKRFINEIISSQDRTKLLESILIYKTDLSNVRDTNYKPTDEKKIKFMFEIRNSFTHSGLTYADPGPGYFGINDDEWTFGVTFRLNGSLNWGFKNIYWEKKSTHKFIYLVTKWPFILIEIIERAINPSTTYSADSPNIFKTIKSTGDQKK